MGAGGSEGSLHGSGAMPRLLAAALPHAALPWPSHPAGILGGDARVKSEQEQRETTDEDTTDNRLFVFSAVKAFRGRL